MHYICHLLRFFFFLNLTFFSLFSLFVPFSGHFSTTNLPLSIDRRSTARQKESRSTVSSMDSNIRQLQTLKNLFHPSLEKGSTQKTRAQSCFFTKVPLPWKKVSLYAPVYIYLYLKLIFWLQGLTGVSNVY